MPRISPQDRLQLARQGQNVQQAMLQRQQQQQQYNLQLALSYPQLQQQQFNDPGYAAQYQQYNQYPDNSDFSLLESGAGDYVDEHLVCKLEKRLNKN